MTYSPTTSYLDRPGGRLAYDVAGDGPVVVCLPGMGDVRQAYRFLAPALVTAGHRVVTLDLRGHGESDTTFTRHDGVAIGGDVLALLDELGAATATIVGNSLGAAGAAWAAADAPGRIEGLVLIGPFVRDVPLGVATRLALRLGFVRPWGPAAWRAFYAKSYRNHAPDDLEEHLARIRSSTSRPGGWRQLVATTRVSHAPIEERLGEVTAPTLVVMGSADPDFPDPEAEARLVADRLGGDVLLVPAAGHYPHAQHPEVVAPAIVEFLARVTPRA
jgi:pimeloyl-ACP methyl ester carboxylesterase